MKPIGKSKSEDGSICYDDESSIEEGGAGESMII